MGRNSGGQIHFTGTEKPDGSSKIYTWYCEQHAKTDRVINNNRAVAFATLKAHIESEHGNVEQ